MSWTTPLSSFEGLEKLLKNKETQLTDVLKDEGLKGAFKRQLPTLLLYLSSHLIEVTDIALGNMPEMGRELQGAAMFCLSNDAPVFTNQISTNKTFLSKLSNFLKQENIENDNLVVFYRIFKNCLEKSSGFMFINFPDKKEFVDSLVRLFDVLPIYLLVKDIATNCYPTVIQFLETSKSLLTFLDTLNDNDRHNARILEILTDFSKTTPSLSKILTTNDVLDKLLNVVYNGGNKSSANASILIKSLIDLDGKTEVKPFQEAGNYILSKVDDLSSFIQKEGPYSSSKSQAFRTLSYLIPKMVPIPDHIVTLAKYLFDLIFSNPSNSFLHNDFVDIYTKIKDKTNIDSLLNLQEVIPNKFNTDYHEIICNYWGQLFKITELIDKSPNKADTPEWKEFMEKFYSYYLDKTTSIYGGLLPIQDESDTTSSYEDDDEYEYEYEEDSSSSTASEYEEEDK